MKNTIKKIETVQFINASAEELEKAFSSYPKWLDDAFENGLIDCVFEINKPVYLRISTKEGYKDIVENDWIIRDELLLINSKDVKAVI